MDAAFIHFGINTKYLLAVSAGTGVVLAGGYHAVGNKVLSNNVAGKGNNQSTRHVFFTQEMRNYDEVFLGMNNF